MTDPKFEARTKAIAGFVCFNCGRTMADGDPCKPTSKPFVHPRPFWTCDKVTGFACDPCPPSK